MEKYTEYLSLFKKDSEHFLSALNKVLLELEKDPRQRELVQEAFRLIHSLKSEASYLNLDKISGLAHEIESLLEEGRENPSVFTPGFFSRIFSCLDSLETLDFPDDTEEPSADKEETPGKSRKEPATQDVLFTDFEKKLLEEARLRGERLYRVICELDPDTPMAFAKAYLVVSNLEQVVNVIRINPSLESREGQDFSRLDLCFTSSTEEKEIYRAVSLDQVEKVHLAELDYTSFLGGRMVLSGTEPVKQKPASVNLRIPLDKIDSLLREVDSLRYQIFSLRGSPLERDNPELMENLNLRVKSLSSTARTMRMVPLEEELLKLHRLVRDLSLKLGKKASLQLDCKGIEVDRGIIDSLFDPLVHLVRNAMDHGIEIPEERFSQGKSETGRITLKAAVEKGFLTLSVKDDGRGIDRREILSKARAHKILDKQESLDLLSLLIRQGFSTKAETSDLSGRGIGLDLVAQRVKQVAGGSFSMETRKGEGTEFLIKIPASSLMGILLAKTGSVTLGISKRSVEAVEEINPKEYSRGREGSLRYQNLPVYTIYGKVLAMNTLPRELFALRLNNGRTQAYLLVEELLFEQEIPEEGLEILKELKPYMYKVSINGHPSEFLLLNPALIG